jgi:hypothetical protein
MSATATVLAPGVVAAAPGVTSPPETFFSFEQAVSAANARTTTVTLRAERA